MVLAELRDLFPVTRDRVYLDHASDGPIPTPSAKAIHRLLDLYSRQGKLPIDECRGVVEETRQCAATLLGAALEEIAFIKNTSQGILIAVSSIPWKSGDNVVLSRDAFPANLYPWRYLLPDVEKRWVSTDELRKTSGESPVERLLGSIDGRTRAVAVDWVHFLSGSRLVLDEIGTVLREKGIFFVVDAIQGLGALALDLEQVKCDFLCAGGSKWLLSPHGTGLLYLSSVRSEELRPSNIGWLSAQWDDFHNFKVTMPLRAGAGRLEEGTLNLIGIYGLRESLKIFLRLGAREIEKRVVGLAHSIGKRLTELGCDILTPVDSDQRSGILTFRSSRVSSDELWNLLATEDVICSLREGWIRLAPHFYNTYEETDFVVDLISTRLKAEEIRC